MRFKTGSKQTNIRIQLTTTRGERLWHDPIAKITIIVITIAIIAIVAILFGVVLNWW